MFGRPHVFVGARAPTSQRTWRKRAYLYNAYDTDIHADVNAMSRKSQSRTLDAMLEKRIKVLETSLCVRLIDAVASLLGLYHVVSFEWQAAMALEVIAAHGLHALFFAAMDQPASGSITMDTRKMACSSSV